MFDNDTTHTGLYGQDGLLTGPMTESTGLETQSGRHPVNIAQLVMGIVFAGMVLVWALIQGNVVEAGDYRWLMPVPWLAAGAVGLAASVWPSRKRARR